MGLSASKRVHQTLRNSPDFCSACDSVYEAEIELAQHAFPGIKPYQLYSSMERLHQTLDTNPSVPLIKKWAHSPPTREQVDRGYRAISSSSRRGSESGEEGEAVLGNGEFKELAVEVYSDVVVSNAREAVLKRVPIGVAGIAGVGMLLRPGREVVAAVIGVYVLGATTAVYLSLNG